MHDFYVIVDDYRQRLSLAARSPPRTRCCRPTCSISRIDGAPRPLRAKYAVVSRADLAARVPRRTRRAGVWARFAQPIAAAYARDALGRDGSPAAGADAVCTAVVRGLAARGAAWQAVDSGPLWCALFRASYAAELRPERAGASDAIYAEQPARFDALLAAAIAVLARERRARARAGPAPRACGCARSRPRAAVGRAAEALAALQLLKSAVDVRRLGPLRALEARAPLGPGPRGERAPAAAPVAVRVAAAAARVALGRVALTLRHASGIRCDGSKRAACSSVAAPSAPLRSSRCAASSASSAARTSSSVTAPTSSSTAPVLAGSYVVARARRRPARARFARVRCRRDDDHAARVDGAAHDALPYAHQLALAARVDAEVARAVGARHLAHARVDAEPAQRARRSTWPCARSAARIPVRPSASGVHHANASVRVWNSAAAAAGESQRRVEAGRARGAHRGREARPAQIGGRERDDVVGPVQPQRLGPRAACHLAQDGARTPARRTPRVGNAVSMTSSGGHRGHARSAGALRLALAWIRRGSAALAVERGAEVGHDPADERHHVLASPLTSSSSRLLSALSAPRRRGAPASVSSSWMPRRSLATGTRRTQPACSRPSTSEVSVGRLTPTAAASSLARCGPARPRPAAGTAAS